METADGYYSEAILEILKIRRSVSPNHIATLYCIRADLRLIMNRVEDAEKDAAQGSVYNPHDDGIKDFLAKQVVRHQKLARTQGDEHETQGLVYYKQGNYGMAEELFTKAITLLPTCCRYLRLRVLANWGLGLYLKVEDDCNEALRHGVVNTFRREMLYIRALARYNMELYKSAEADLKELLSNKGVLVTVDSQEAKYEKLLENVQADMRAEEKIEEERLAKTTLPATERVKYQSNPYGRGRRKTNEPYAVRLALRLQRYIDACNKLPPFLRRFQEYVGNLPEGEKTINGFVKAMYKWGLLCKSGSIAKVTKLTGVGPTKRVRITEQVNVRVKINGRVTRVTSTYL